MAEKKPRRFKVTVLRKLNPSTPEEQDVHVTYQLLAASEAEAKEIIVNRAASRGGFQGEWV